MKSLKDTFEIKLYLVKFIFNKAKTFPATKTCFTENTDLPRLTTDKVFLSCSSYCKLSHRH